MAFKYFDRVSVSSSTTGTGALTLGAATAGFRTFASVFSNADTMYYVIQDSNNTDWEVGTGTYNTSGNTLSRTTVLASSNAGSRVNFTSGALTVFVDVPAAQLSGSNGSTTGTGALVFANGPTLTGIVGIVTGPLSSTDNAIAVYDGLTGQILKNSSPTISGGTITASVTGNAATATALQNARTIGGVSFDGTINIVPQTIQIVDAGGDTTTFPLLATDATGSLQPVTDAGLTFNAAINALSTTTFIGALTGNSDTATALAAPRTIGGVSFNGTANIVPQTIESANEATDTTCFPLFITASGTQQLQPKNAASLTFNSNTGALSATSLGGTLTTAAQTNITSVSTLTGGATGAGFTVALGTSTITGILGSANGGTANGFTKFSGPATSEKTFTLPNVSDSIACLAQQNAYTKQQYFVASALTSSAASIAWNAQTAQAATHTATENTTLANPTNLVAGATYTFIWTQHASSPKTLAFGAVYKWPGSVVPVVTATNSAVDIFTFYSDGTNMYGVVQYAFA